METSSIILDNAMVLDGVDVFVKVVQLGGFSAAARQLRMPTSTVSAKVARLEERLGATLIQRSTRRMQVTDAGRGYYERCLEALLALEAGELGLATANAGPRGLLRITAPSDIAQILLLPVIEAYLERYPNTEIDLIATNRQIDMLAENVDLAVRAGRMEDSSLTSRKFVDGELGLWATQPYLDRHGVPETPEELDSHSVMGLSRMPRLIKLSDGARSFVVPHATRLRCDDMQTLGSFILRGGGIGLFPTFGATGAMDDPRMVRVLPTFRSEVASVCFVYPAQRYLNANVRAFIDLATC